MRGDRREFLRQVGQGLGGLAGLLASGTGARADRLRILGSPESGGPGSVVAVGRDSPDLRRFLATIRIAPGQGHGTLHVLWLQASAGTAGPALAMATLEDAREAGALLVTERAQASVPSLIVENRGKAYVLLLAGEILLGGKQNRVLREDLLLAPGSGPLDVGVYCVEQGRWTGSTRSFESAGTFAAPTLRARVMEKADQQRIWATIEQYAIRAQAASPTRSYQEIYQKREVKEHLAQVGREIDQRPPAGALGAAVFVGQGLAGLDLFFDAGLFAREWPKLLGAYALEVYQRAVEPVPDTQRLRERVEGLLQLAGKAEGTLRASPGAGQLFEFLAPGLKGAALLFEGRVVHAAVL